MIKDDVISLIGKTPLIKLNKISSCYHLFGKQEFIQPGGSVKDRVAYQMIHDAYKNQLLVKGQLVVEMTSGNMGAGLAVVCKQFGNPFLAVMSKGNSPERAKLLKALGARVILTDQIDGVPGMVTGKDIAHAAEIAMQYAKKHHGFYVDQFNNKSSIAAHYNTTGPEIWNDLKEIDLFISSVGSGGTLIGVSKYLKSKNPNIKCVAVEPENASILKTSTVISGKHIIQGTGYGIIPPLWQNEFVDDVISVSDKEVIDMTHRLSTEQGLFVGYSSGANVSAALKYAEMNTELRNIVTILCDTGFKYSDL